MPGIGGSVESVTLKGRTYAVPADAEVTIKLGGAENEIEANGDGKTARIIKTQVPWAISGLVVEIDHTVGDQEFLVGLQKDNDFFPITITLADGTVLQGSGQIIGEVLSSSQKATAEIGLSGSGELTKQ